MGALNYSLDFVGGTATTVTFDKEYTLEEVDSQMVPELEKITGCLLYTSRRQRAQAGNGKTGASEVGVHQANPVCNPKT